MKRIEIKKLFSQTENYTENSITVCGWIKSCRSSKHLAFLTINDGSSYSSLQVIAEENLGNFPEISKLNVGGAVSVVGRLIMTPEAKQPFEIHAEVITVEGESTPDYPLQKKAHSLEFLRTIPHLRMRTNTLSAVFRVRSVLAQAIHEYFAQEGFVYAHTPIITANDCEGAGEMFQVTTLSPAEFQPNEKGEIDYSKDFFEQKASLTVSGQLEGECMAMSFGKIYTFGPTFRAEKSYTQRHAAEFWMVEPEIAFADLDDDMELAEDMIKFLIKSLMGRCPEELQFFNQFYDKELLERLDAVISSDFGHITYTEAVEILEKNNDNFEYKVSWGCDLQTEHERYLTENIFKKPIFVTDYPKEIKAFYMRVNEDNNTVAAMDMLVPGVGELIGGSQREERLDVLISRMEELNLSPEDYSWYLDLRRFGGAKHCGFGLGFERLIMYTTGISNIRDVLPFPRTTGNICR